MELSEKAKSRAQQRFFGMVRATQKGEMDSPSSEVAQAAASISTTDVKKFAKTKHKGLPEKKKVEEGSLHKWFKGSKSKDGKGGWVNVVTGGTCASDKPGEGTPKCVSSSKRASMSKSERLSAARRKKKADPGQQSKSGAAKPTYVSTDSPRKKKMKEQTQLSNWRLDLEEKKAQKCWPGYEKKGTKKMFGKTYNNCVKKEDVQLEMHDTPKNVKKIAKELDKAVEMHKSQAKRLRKAGISEESYGSRTAKEGDNEAAAAARRRIYDRASDKDKDHMDKVEIANQRNKERYGSGKVKLTKEEVVTEADKKGKGSGSKDACYHKVKSRYSVWPSAYASGALVKCRKVGAANWGNSTKKESYSDWRSELNLTEDDMKGMSVKSGHKRPTKSGAGMTQKGVEAYRRKNPGSKLKTAVTTEPSKLKKGSKDSNRRKSYCARSAGQMKKFPKAAKDPDSRLRQARRRWNC